MSDWRAVPGFVGFYEASDAGEVRSVDRTVLRSGITPVELRGRTLRQVPDGHGYSVVNLCRDGKARLYGVHQVVALAFLGPRPEGMEVCHANGIPTDNRVSNIRYDTRSSNQIDRWQHTGRKRST